VQRVFRSKEVFYLRALARAVLGAIRHGVPFSVETDVSDHVLALILSQDGRPVAYMSRTLSACERRYPAVEKEATAIIEAVLRWSHFVKGRHFTLVPDQEAVSFMFHQNNRGKIRNPKILGWRLELSHMTYNIRHKPGSENVTADAFSRACVLFSLTSLQNLHLLVTLVRRDFITLCGSVIYLIFVKRRGKFVATVERV